MPQMGLLICLTFLQISLGWSLNVTFVPLRNLELAENYPGIRIIDGEPAALGQFPYQVGILLQTDSGIYLCGGSIIGAEWILTAGHCVTGGKTFTVYMGGISVIGNENGRIQMDTTEYILHPEFDSKTLYADIGLLHLNEAIPFNDRIQPVALTSPSYYVDDAVDLTVSGFGAIDDENSSVNNLNYVDLTSITNTVCASIFGHTSVTDGTLCARGHPNESTCSGDSGGPLTTNNSGVVTQVGVVSWVYQGGCAEGYPSGYTRLSYYRDWITAETGI